MPLSFFASLYATEFVTSDQTTTINLYGGDQGGVGSLVNGNLTAMLGNYKVPETHSVYLLVIGLIMVLFYKKSVANKPVVNIENIQTHIRAFNKNISSFIDITHRR